jgi:hypothetical protein
MSLELGDDATYVVRGLGSTFFWMQSGGILFVLVLKINLLSFSVCKIISVVFHLRDVSALSIIVV